MPGAFLTREASGLDHALAILNRLASPQLAAEGLGHLGGLIESQTRGRFQTRTAPDGTPWAPWSQAYAASRRAGQSLLVAGGALRDSIAWHIEGDDLLIGSNLIYAAVHQAGSGDKPHKVAAHQSSHRSEFDAPNERTFKQVKAHERAGGIPAREYLGISEADAAEINEALGAWIDTVVQ